LRGEKLSHLNKDCLAIFEKITSFAPQSITTHHQARVAELVDAPVEEPFALRLHCFLTLKRKRYRS